MESNPATDLERWLAAFPPDLNPDVRAVLTVLPPPRPEQQWLLSPDSTDSSRHPRGLSISGSRVELPGRHYLDPVCPADAPVTLSPRQRAILGCIHSRHDDGYVRQAWAKEIATLDVPWVVPFVLQLVGEYVVEILDDLVEATAPLDDPSSSMFATYSNVITENGPYLELTAARVASYWACYYRWTHMKFSDYPGQVLLNRLRGCVGARR